MLILLSSNSNPFQPLPPNPTTRRVCIAQHSCSIAGFTPVPVTPAPRSRATQGLARPTQPSSQGHCVSRSLSIPPERSWVTGSPFLWLGHGPPHAGRTLQTKQAPIVLQGLLLPMYHKAAAPHQSPTVCRERVEQRPDFGTAGLSRLRTHHPAWLSPLLSQRPSTWFLLPGFAHSSLQAFYELGKAAGFIHTGQRHRVCGIHGEAKKTSSSERGAARPAQLGSGKLLLNRTISQNAEARQGHHVTSSNDTKSKAINRRPLHNLVCPQIQGHRANCTNTDETVCLSAPVTALAVLYPHVLEMD